MNHARNALAIAAIALCGGAFAATAQPAKDTAQQQRAACEAGNTHQDKAACLKEATNAAADQKKNPAKFQGKADTAANARARCESLAGADKADCVARAGGQGTVKGSVESGGVYREIVTLERLEPILQQPAPAAEAPAKTPQ